MTKSISATLASNFSGHVTTNDKVPETKIEKVNFSISSTATSNTLMPKNGERCNTHQNYLMVRVKKYWHRHNMRIFSRVSATSNKNSQPKSFKQWIDATPMKWKKTLLWVILLKAVFFFHLKYLNFFEGRLPFFQEYFSNRVVTICLKRRKYFLFKHLTQSLKNKDCSFLQL